MMTGGRSTMNAARAAFTGLVSIGFFMTALFAPAGTFDYRQAWVYLGISLASSVAIMGFLQRADPRLLERRLRGPAEERNAGQKLLQVAAILVFTGTLVASSLDHRFGWSHVPPLAIIVGDALLASGYAIVFFSFRENTFASVNIAVEAGQTVISTGPYAIVRHPYYSGLLAGFAATPLALGSWWGLLLAAPVLLVLGSRIRYEERFLARHLPGYVKYCDSVRYRLIPAIW